jgi:hypothetical protein
VVERIPAPELGDVFSAIEDKDGVVWLELGASRAGRIDLRGANPSIRIFGREDGLTDGWVQISTITPGASCPPSGWSNAFPN